MRNKVTAILLVIGLALLGASVIHAVSGGALVSYSFSCTDVSVTYTAVTFDRDNTGSGYEAYTLVITDGAGNILDTLSNAWMIGVVVPAQTEVFSFATPPIQNPLHMQLYSHAGNGFPQQMIWDFTGNSPCLPPPTVCDQGAPAGSVLRTLPHETPAYYDADLNTATGFTIPAGTWFTYDVSGDFTHLFVTCGANPVWVASSALQ